MDDADRIETALEACLDEAVTRECPPLLADALRWAVFPGGARLRPRLVLAVARACGDDDPPLADAAACAVELLHCASLVHDDLPCFDDAGTRRGRPSVHRAFGEPLAVLVGDGLIVQAFAHLARVGARRPVRSARLVGAVAAGVGCSTGIVAGQAWESEPVVDLGAYHQAKTGALFAAAAAAGACAAGGDPRAWHQVGLRLGQAYQLADDLADAAGSSAALGKPVGQDAAHHRPNAARQLGPARTAAALRQQLDEAAALVPPCRGREALQAWLRGAVARVLPQQLQQAGAAS